METGLYFLKTRYYDSELGRFINADDVSYLDPETINGLNLYAYCLNNPMMTIDQNGHFFFSFLIGLGIAALTFAVVNTGTQLVGDLINYAATRVFSYGVSVIGAAVGQTFGYALSQSVIGGLKVAKIFSSALLMGAGKFVGGIAGGLIGTAISDYFVNTAQGKPTTFGGILESESLSWITDFIRWL